VYVSNHRFHIQWIRPGWGQIVISLLVLVLGVLGAQALNRVDQDLRVMYTEYTVAATDLAHITADIMRYRATIFRALQAPTQQDFERITSSLPEQRTRIEQVVDRYAATSLRVSSSGRSEQKDLQAVRESLKDYFAASQRTLTPLRQVWQAGTPKEAEEFRHQAELNASDQAGTQLVKVSLALDRLLETVADVAKDMREDGTLMIRAASVALIVGAFLLAGLNLFIMRGEPAPAAAESSIPAGSTTPPAGLDSAGDRHSPPLPR
jgi:hypothetical protein